jgi:hypothetical protein
MTTVEIVAVGNDYSETSPHPTLSPKGRGGKFPLPARERELALREAKG